jgi:predicted aldo/keto reductase-like oxidoreductase
MNQPRNGMNRRQFVSAGLAAAAGAGLAGGPVAAAAVRESGKRVNGVPTTVLPRGEREVPIFGVGCAYIGHLMAQGKMVEAEEVLRYAHERGLRYFDSATLYPTDAVAARALAPVIDDIYLTTRSPALPPDPAKVMRDHVEVTLRRYKTDVIDCFKIHNAVDYDDSMLALDELEKLREEGKVKQIGVSSHVHFETIFRLIDTGRLDQVLLGRSYFPKGYYQLLSQHNMDWRERCMNRAHELGMNVIGMKVLGGVLYTRSPERAPDFPEEKRKRLPAAAIRWGYADPRITLYNIGIGSPQDVDDTMAIFAGDMTFTQEDHELLAEYSTVLWGSPMIRGMEEPYKHPGDAAYHDEDMNWLFRRMEATERELRS